MAVVPSIGTNGVYSLIARRNCPLRAYPRLQEKYRKSCGLGEGQVARGKKPFAANFFCILFG